MVRLATARALGHPPDPLAAAPGLLELSSKLDMVLERLSWAPGDWSSSSSSPSGTWASSTPSPLRAEAAEFWPAEPYFDELLGSSTEVSVPAQKFVDVPQFEYSGIQAKEPLPKLAQWSSTAGTLPCQEAPGDVHDHEAHDVAPGVPPSGLEAREADRAALCPAPPGPLAESPAHEEPENAQAEENAVSEVGIGTLLPYSEPDTSAAAQRVVRFDDEILVREFVPSSCLGKLEGDVSDTSGEVMLQCDAAVGIHAGTGITKRDPSDPNAEFSLHSVAADGNHLGTLSVGMLKGAASDVSDEFTLQRDAPDAIHVGTMSVGMMKGDASDWSDEFTLQGDALMERGFDEMPLPAPLVPKTAVDYEAEYWAKLNAIAVEDPERAFWIERHSWALLDDSVMSEHPEWDDFVRWCEMVSVERRASPCLFNFGVFLRLVDFATPPLLEPAAEEDEEAAAAVAAAEGACGELADLFARAAGEEFSSDSSGHESLCVPAAPAEFRPLEPSGCPFCPHCLVAPCAKRTIFCKG